MKIERIRARVVAVPLDDPVMTTLGPIDDSLFLAVDIEASGMVGAGYGWAVTEPELRALRTLVLALGQGCIGRDPREIARLRAELSLALRWSGRVGLGAFALGVIEMCLWDLAGKACDTPIWRMLGGSPHPIPVYASGLFLSASLDEIAAEAQRYADAGYRGVKMRVGKPDIEEDIERTSAIKRLLEASGTPLMVDAALGWTGREALDRTLALAELGIHWIEDPVDYREGGGIAELAAIRRACPGAICAGEFLAGADPFAAMIAVRAADYLNIDLLHVGGVLPWLEVLTLARTSGFVPVTHMFPEVAVHVCSTLPAPHAIEYVPGWSTKMFTNAEVPADGLLTPPSGPGLGVDYDWDKLDAWKIGDVEEVA